MSISPQPEDHDGTDPLSAEAQPANDEEGEELDSDLLDPRFASGPSLLRPPTVDDEDRRDMLHTPPGLDDDLASDDAEETSAADGPSPAQESTTEEHDPEPYPSSEDADLGPVDSEIPAEGTEATAGDEETPARTADTLPQDPADESSPASTEEALADEDGRDSANEPAEDPAEDSTLTATDVPDEPAGESLDASGSDEGSATLSDDQALLDDDDIFTFQAFEEAPEDTSTSPGMTTSTADEPEPTGTSVQFQHGSNGYAGVVDTYLHQAQPDTSRASSTTLVVDSVDKKGEVQTLLRFNDILGSATGQIPLGATILSATLVVQTTSKGDGATLHRMLLPWSDSATWNSLENGIQADGIEAMIPSDLDTGFIPTGTTQLDVTASLQAWADGQENHGWALLPQGPDGWDFHSAEGSTPPTLIVEYSTANGGPVNNPPVAQDDTATTTQGLAVQIAVLDNDSDPDGDTLTVGAVTQPANGSVTLNPDGTLTYTPDEDFAGSDSFTYQASDGELLSDPATVNVSVEQAEEPPPTSTIVQFQHGSNGYAGVVDTYLHQAQPDTSRASSTTLVVDSVDKKGEVQTLLRFNDVLGSATGQIPLGATILSATLVVQTTSKGDGATLHRMLLPWSDSATWNSLENGIQADGIEAMIPSDLDTGFIPTGTTQLDVTASLQAWADGQENHGWALLPQGPDGWDFHSAEGSTPPTLIVEYSTANGGPVNNPPVAQDDTATTTQGLAVQIAVLDNDSDPDGDTLTVGAVTQPANGSVTLNPDGTLTYTPDEDFAGSDSFTYQASDGELLSDPATVNVSVEQEAPVNNPPVANDDTVTTTQGLAVQIAVLDNDSDPDGDPLTVGAVTQPANGSVTLNPDGTLTYTPEAGFVGADSFTYQASDGELESAPATVNVTVSPSIVQFQQGQEGYAGVVDTELREEMPGTSQATSTTLEVDGFDTNGASGSNVQALLRFDNLFGGANEQIPLGATIHSATLELHTTNEGDGARFHRMLQPWSDTATWDSLGSGIQANGVEALADGDVNTGFVEIGTTHVDVTTSLQAWADGQLNLGWALLPQGSNGWQFYSAEGTTPPKLIVEFSHTPQAPDNNPPLATDDSAETIQGSQVQINVLSNDSDPDDDPLSVGALTSPANGSVTLNPDGTLTYTPDEDFFGEDSFTYRASDGQALSDPATVSITVHQSDVPPPLPLETSYIATAFNTSDRRNFEHTNATKSFYHDGDWWGVLPEVSGWHVYRFDGPLPDPGTMGGWTKSSPTMLTSGRRADIAWDNDTDTLYVINFGPSEPSPRLYKLGYDITTRTFDIEANIQLTGEGGVLTGAEWQRNTEMSLGLDQNGSPVVALIGPSAAGGEKGLKLAYPTSSSLATWSTTTIDPGPSTSSGSNGDNKVDFVAFRLDGIDHVGLVYGDDATGLWKLAYQPTPSSPTGYGSGWTIDTITDAVVLDNHLAALWNGTNILMTMKDDKDALWAIKGIPGSWEEPVLVHAATHGASRPTLAYDEDNEMLFVFYQENTNRPYGDIYFKATFTDELIFETQDAGTRIVTSTRSDENMSDPQMPYHSVGAATDGKFFVFARNTEAKEIWYNDLQFDDDWLIA
ncbi:Ig-like domain-containing protein [Halomonas sp. HK25]|uniref:Ig-like domain-containing protein n=1 Tax=Halomonas sp. HK25 TaxID=3394321 RepID=UPI0039FCF6DF